MKPEELADELEAAGEGYLRTLKPAWTGTNHDEALALVVVVADNLPTILSSLRRVAEIATAASAFVAAHDALDEHLGDFFVSANAKGLVWTHGNWKAELEALRQALTGEA